VWNNDWNSFCLIIKHNTQTKPKSDRLVYRAIMNLLGVRKCNLYKWNRRCRWERMYWPFSQRCNLLHFSVWEWMFYTLRFHSRFMYLMTDTWTCKSKQAIILFYFWMEKHKHLFGLINDAWDRFWLTYYECRNTEFQVWIKGKFGLSTD
jgi:hypothetical protein